MVERAVILCDGPELKLEHFDHLLSKMKEDFYPAQPEPRGSYDLHQFEREAIEKALREAGHNKSRAARLLGLSRQALDRRMVKFGIR
jgi:DNA-binding NtrC family response regulator